MSVRVPTVLRWTGLVGASALLAFGLEKIGAPAAFLLGPMLASIAFAASGGRLSLSQTPFAAAQGIIGCLVAHAITIEILATILADWLPMALVVTTTVAAGGIVGWVLARWGSLPGSTAAWGSSPGAAAAMVAMAGDYGADIRLVAFMQYLRLFLVVASASLVSALLLGAKAAPVAQTAPEAVHWAGLAPTLGVALAGAWLGRALKVPSGALLVPLVLGAVLKGAGLVELALPPPVLALAYALLGWYVGLQFDRAVIAHALRALPQLVLGVLLLMALCGLSAWMLAALTGVSPLSAYLATSPGGLDSITVIAIGGQADVPFVLAFQTLRLFVVILTGPVIARLICRTMRPTPP